MKQYNFIPFMILIKNKLIFNKFDNFLIKCKNIQLYSFNHEEIT